MIDKDLWLKALSDVGVDDRTNDERAVTIGEFQEAMGLTRQSAMYRLETLVASKKATRTQKRVHNSVGRLVTYKAYRLVEGPCHVPTPRSGNARRHSARGSRRSNR